MPVASEVAALAVSAVTGAIKLGKRLDQILAEDVALESGMSLAIGKVVLPPAKAVMKARLRALLKATEEELPDPLAVDRERLVLISKRQASQGTKAELEAFYSKYGLPELQIRTIDPDAETSRRLRERNDAWDLSDADIRQLTFLVSAGADFRENSTVFRISATVLDSLAEFASIQAEFFVRDPETRKLLVSIVSKFSEGDLAEVEGWSGLLRQALRSTLGGLVDNRELLAERGEWLELVLGVLARARTASEEGDDFFIGLLRGEGYQLLLRGGLEEAAGRLSGPDVTALQLTLSEVLADAASRIGKAPVGFEAWFQDNWNELAGSAIQSLGKHGPRLFDLDGELLVRTYGAALDVLAEGVAKNAPTGELLRTSLEAVVAVVADDPAILDDAISREWLRDLVGSLAGVVKKTGIKEAFSRTALEGYLRAALETVAEHPEIVDVDSDIVRSLLTEVLGGLAKAPTLSVDSLGTAVVAGALRAIEAQPGLIDGDFGSLVGDFAGRVAELVKEKKLSGLQGTAVIEAGVQAIADNPELRDKASKAVARSIVEAVVGVAGDDETGLLGGEALVATTRRLLRIFAARGRLLVGTSTTAKTIVSSVEALLSEGLELAAAELGRKLDRSMVPDLLAALVEARVEGELDDDSTRDDLVVVLDELSAAMGVVARLTYIEASLEEGS